MRVLVTGHGRDRDAVNSARRLVPYERLVILTPDPEAEDLAALCENEALAGIDVDVQGVDAADLIGCLSHATRLLEDPRATEMRVHVAGGPNLLTNALLLAAFQKGVDAFFCHPRGVSRLPVARSMDLAEMFTPPERDVLLGLPERGDAVPLDKLAREGLPLAVVKTVLLRLVRRGLVDANPEDAALTTTGAYYRAHLGA